MEGIMKTADHLLPNRMLALALLMPMATACSEAEKESGNPPSTEPEAIVGYNVTLRPPVEPGKPYTLISGLDPEHEIDDLGVSGDYVFFATSGQGVYRLPKYGGQLQAVELDRKAHTVGIAGNATEVFWLHDGYEEGDKSVLELRRREATGGEVTTLPIDGYRPVNANFTPTMLADAGHVYLLAKDSIRAVSLDGTDRNVIMPFPPSQGVAVPDWLASYPEIYASTCGLGVPTPGWDCQILRFNVDSGQSLPLTGPLPLAKPYDSVEAADESSLFAVKGRNLVRIAKADMTVSELYAPGPGESVSSFYMLADATDVYFMTYNGSDERLRSVPKAGGAVRDVGWGPELSYGVWDLAQDNQFIFVLTAVKDPWVEGNAILAYPKLGTAP
jgi:hypothetical protein